jgi:hypothetical protein
MVFKDSKYTHWYNQLVEQAKVRVLPRDVYTEKHHIIPRSLGGDNSIDNLVRLTAREHFVCHWLLTKMVTGSAKYKMAYAFGAMLYRGNNNQSRYKVTGKIYENIKISRAKILSEAVAGTNNPMYGKKHSANSTAKRKAWSSQSNQKLVKLGTHPLLGSESNNKRLAEGTHPSQHKISCLCCREESSVSMFIRWHGNKCRGPKDTTPKIRSCETKWSCVCGKSGVGASNYSRWHSNCAIKLAKENHHATA